MHIEEATVILRDLRFYAYHGMLPQERITGGEYIVHLEMSLLDPATVILNDKIDNTINYAEAYRIVQEEMLHPSSLLEHVSGRILHRLFASFSNLDRVILEVCKTNPPIGADTRGCSVVVKAHR